MKLTLRGSPHCLELSGAGLQPPCISGQGEPEIDAPSHVSSRVLPSLEGPSSWPRQEAATSMRLSTFRQVEDPGFCSQTKPRIPV